MFGGTNGNEGLGLFSICFDWQVGFHKIDTALSLVISKFVVHLQFRSYGNSLEGPGKLKVDEVTNGYD